VFVVVVVVGHEKLATSQPVCGEGCSLAAQVLQHQPPPTCQPESGSQAQAFLREGFSRLRFPLRKKPSRCASSGCSSTCKVRPLPGSALLTGSRSEQGLTI
jgi:hypothetical protein